MKSMKTGELMLAFDMRISVVHVLRFFFPTVNRQQAFVETQPNLYSEHDRPILASRDSNRNTSWASFLRLKTESGDGSPKKIPIHQQQTLPLERKEKTDLTLVVGKQLWKKGRFLALETTSVRT